jgi:hypothetical protein
MRKGFPTVPRERGEGSPLSTDIPGGGLGGFEGPREEK